MSMRSSSPTASVHVWAHARGGPSRTIQVAEHDRSPPATGETGVGARSYLHPTNVAKAQRQMERSLTFFRQNAARDRVEGVDRGWQMAADHLAHFLDGTGAPVVLSSEQINRMPAVLEAEENSRSNFSTTFAADTGNPILNASINGLKDGASLELSDFWDSSVGLSADHIGHYAAIGRSSVYSEAALRVGRKGVPPAVGGTPDRSLSGQGRG